jgi:hypothetical protein
MFKTRQEAISKGEKQFFDGKLCKKGHLAPKHVSGGCIECRKQHSLNYQKNNKEKIKEWHKNNHAKNYSTEKRRIQYRKNIVSEIFNHAKQRAKVKNISFTITVEDVIIPDKCPVFGINLDHSDRLHAPTLDRIINELGYVKGNVQVISAKANRLKNNGTIEEFQQIINYMKNGTNS